jgi:hypothetical protein
MKNTLTKIFCLLILSGFANSSFAWYYRQGCWSVTDRKEMYIPNGESTSWGNASDLSLLGAAGGLGSLVAAIGANLISMGRDAVNSAATPSQKPNAVLLAYESDFGETITFLYQGRAFYIGEDVFPGEHGYIKLDYYHNAKRAGIPYFVKKDIPKLADKNSPSLDYLETCYEKTPIGYTTVTNIPDAGTSLKYIAAPESALKILLERDGVSSQPIIESPPALATAK